MLSSVVRRAPAGCCCCWLLKSPRAVGVVVAVAVVAGVVAVETGTQHAAAAGRGGGGGAINPHAALPAFAAMRWGCDAGAQHAVRAEECAANHCSPRVLRKMASEKGKRKRGGRRAQVSVRGG